MIDKTGFTIIVERERQDNEVIFIASSPDINVFAEGKTIDEAIRKFKEGVNAHLGAFPEERELLIKKEDDYEMPLVTKVFL